MTFKFLSSPHIQKDNEQERGKDIKVLLKTSLMEDGPAQMMMMVVVVVLEVLVGGSGSD